MTHVESMFHAAGLAWLLASATMAAMLPDPQVREAITQEIVTALRARGVPAPAAGWYARWAVLAAAVHLQELLLEAATE